MRKITASAIAAAVIFASSALSAQELVFKEDFSTPESITRFDNSVASMGKIVENGAGYALNVTVPEDNKSKSYSVGRVFPLDQVKGKTLIVSAMVKADNVSKPKDPWNGIKFMIYTDSPTKKKNWKNFDGLFGTFDWKKIAYEVEIPEDSIACSLTMGLQDSTGSVTFDDIQITVKAK